ncbi:MAG: arylamine N-acetyltransferase [Acidimicrobiales bacterium]
MTLREGGPAVDTAWRLDGGLVGDVLDRLGVAAPTTPDLPSLTALYTAWCRTVPSDNLLKRIHLSARDPGPLPVTNATEFLEAYLEFGTGGTCWGAAMGLYGLLAAVGYDVSVGAGHMVGITPPWAGPAHGCVLVNLDGALYDIDGYVLCEEPIPLAPTAPTRGGSPLLAAEATPVDGTWEVRFRTGHSERRLTYRINVRTDDPDLYSRRWEISRERSVLNTLFVIRRNTDDGGVITYSRNKVHRLEPDGALTTDVVTDDERDTLLVGSFGLSPAIVEKLPPDEPDAKDIP